MTDLLRPETSRTGWPATWPLVLAFVCYPLWWALGFAPFVWVLFAIPMAARLALKRGMIGFPPGFGIWLLFMAIVLLSGAQLGPSSRAFGFAIRYAGLVATSVVFIYAYNLPRTATPPRFTLRAIGAIWFAVVVGGFLGLAFPGVRLPSFSARLLPGSLTSHDFIQQLITPQFAQVHHFLGFPLARPSAPYVYTNVWGAVFALTFPFALALTLTSASPRVRRLLMASLVLGMIPALLSVNRTLWLGLVVIVVYLSTTYPDPVIRRRLRSISMFGLVLLVAASATFVGEVIGQRAATPHSNAARGDLMIAAAAAISESPLIGHGGPIAYDGPGIRPPVGTQGDLWLIAVSYGIPALALYLWWFSRVFRSAGRRGSELAPFLRASLLAGLIMFPFYDMFGMPLNVVMLASGLALRPGPPVARSREESLIPDLSNEGEAPGSLAGPNWRRGSGGSYSYRRSTTDGP